jgi:hypothetical protein
MHILLDVTRLVSRIGQSQLTGVDRVERAYLDFALGLPRPLFFIAAREAMSFLGQRAGAPWRALPMVQICLHGAISYRI